MSGQVSQSKLHLWRGAIALAYVDHTLDEQEKKRIQEFFSHQSFSAEQRTILENDLKNGIELDPIFDNITDKLDRAHLINISRVLAFADGTYCEKEQAAFDKMLEKHMPTIDIESARNASDTLKTDLKIEEKFAERKRNPIDMLADYITDFLLPPQY